MPRPLIPLAVVFAAIIAVAAALLYGSERDGQPTIAEAPIATPEKLAASQGLAGGATTSQSAQGEDQPTAAAGELASDATSGTGTDIAAAPDTTGTEAAAGGAASAGAEAAATGGDTEAD